MLIAGSVFTGCNSPAQNENAAQQDLNEAQNEANEDAQKVATAEEWAAFKIEANAKIQDNEVRIADLTVRLNKPGKILDPIYKKRIETLEEQNRDLKARLDVYEKNNSDWETFKREFNHDMDELGKALKDFTVDND
jgi:chromosome segregation ATPase